MIGGLQKTVSRLAIVAAAGAMTSTGAMAADLGGDCCADLEERVAELEATTVRKGNRRVSLAISGHVNQTILFWDDGLDDDVYVGDNGQSQTRIRFRGSATINSDWSAGYYMEWGLAGLQGDDQTDDDGDWVPSLRHQALYIKSKRLGTFWLGHTSDAVDGITQLCLGCALGTGPISGGLDIFGGYFVTRGGVRQAETISDHFESAEGTRQPLVKYVSPTFAGFVFSASWHDEELDADDGYALALRYAGEFGAFRVAAGVGYTEQDELEKIGGSISVQHTPSGVYFFVGGGEEDGTTAASDAEVISAGIGVNRKFNSLGNTSFAFAWTHSEDDADNELDQFSFHITQTIDAAAMELYAQYHHIETETGGLENEDFQAVVLGSRIKF